MSGKGVALSVAKDCIGAHAPARTVAPASGNSEKIIRLEGTSVLFFYLMKEEGVGRKKEERGRC